MQDAQCVGGSCTCGQAFYVDFARCSPKKPPGERCARSGQCADHAACSGSGLCQCLSGFFAENKACLPLIGAGQPCR